MKKNMFRKKQEHIHSAGSMVHSIVTPTLQTVLIELTIPSVLNVLTALTLLTVLTLFTVLIVLTVLTYQTLEFLYVWNDPDNYLMCVWKVQFVQLVQYT